MLIVGLVGGVASGKSRVSEIFEQLGAVVLDGDKVGHQVLLKPSIKRAIHNKWGDEVFSSDSEVDRRRLAELVFSDEPIAKSNLAFLESLVHPEIKSILSDQLEAARNRGARLAILDAPVLFKAGWHKLCDEILFVEAPRKLRLERAITRGWSESTFDQRERAQASLETKKQNSTYILDNSGSWESTKRQALKLWNDWKLREPS